MNIFELLSFDIVEFATSIEGILIIVGILFLIVGIILLCMGKGKKKEKGNMDETKATPENAQTVTPPSEPVLQTTVEEAVPKVETPIENKQPTIESPVTNSQQATPIVVPSIDGGLQESATTPVVEPINFTEEVKKDSPVVEEIPTPPAPAPAPSPTVNIEAPISQTPVVEPTPVNSPVIEPVTPLPTTDSVPTIEPVEKTTPVASVVTPEEKSPETKMESLTPPATPPVTVYGGNSPDAIINKKDLEEKPREIYGGANPLENTGSIPTDTVREAYSGGMASTPVITPPSMETPPVVQPQQEPTPVVESLTPVAPVVEPTVNTPAVEPVMPNPAVASMPIAQPTPTSAPAVTAEPKTEEIEKLEF